MASLMGLTCRIFSDYPNYRTKSSARQDMYSMLEQELAESERFNVPQLVKHLFPDDRFPVPLERIVSAVKKDHWAGSTKHWKDFPGASKNKEKLKAFLNDICKTILQEARIASQRTWATRNSCYDPDPKAKRIRDIDLVNDCWGPTWSSALAVLEFQSSRILQDAKSAYARLAENAYKIFSLQDERRFVIGVSLCFSNVRVYVFDRAGVVGSVPFNLKRKPEMFVRLMAGLLCADAATIGLDPSIRHAEDGTRYVTVDAVEYQIVETLFNSQTIRGRGTICWRARRDGVDYVIKDNWTDVSRYPTEADVLRMAEGVQGIAHLVAEEVVSINGTEDSTAHIRSIIGDAEVETRIHHRIVTTPVGEPLTSFRSKKELLMMLIDVIDVHRNLSKAHILHCDISLSNIMISREAVQENASGTESIVPHERKKKAEVAKGLLIDLDYAVITHDSNGRRIERIPETVSHLMGNLPFMAIERLTGFKPGQGHEVYHDLQSFFFVLLWVALKYAGPNGIERKDMDVEDRMFRYWVWPDLCFIGDEKAAHVSTPPKYFELQFTRHVRPYFNDLKPCIEELRQRIFMADNDRPLEHQDLIDILTKAAATLPDDDNWSWKNDPVCYGRKRKFEEDLDWSLKEDSDGWGWEDEDEDLEDDRSCGFILKNKREIISRHGVNAHPRKRKRRA